MARFRNHSHGKVCHRIELSAFSRPPGAQPSSLRSSPPLPPAQWARRAALAHGSPPEQAVGPTAKRRAVSRRALESAVQRAVAERADEHARERALLEASHSREVDVLKRRLSKLAGQIEAQELQLLRRQRGTVETGLASIYRDVQGLAGDDGDFVMKKELMRAIFEANLMLRERVGSLPPPE